MVTVHTLDETTQDNKTRSVGAGTDSAAWQWISVAHHAHTDSQALIDPVGLDEGVAIRPYFYACVARMYVCAYVCMYVCMHACMHECACTHLRAEACIDTPLRRCRIVSVLPVDL
jgi:hypothetical protein